MITVMKDSQKECVPIYCMRDSSCVSVAKANRYAELLSLLNVEQLRFCSIADV